MSSYIVPATILFHNPYIIVVEIDDLFCPNISPSVRHRSNGDEKR